MKTAVQVHQKNLVNSLSLLNQNLTSISNCEKRYTTLQQRISSDSGSLISSKTHNFFFFFFNEVDNEKGGNATDPSDQYPLNFTTAKQLLECYKDLSQTLHKSDK